MPVLNSYGVQILGSLSSNGTDLDGHPNSIAFALQMHNGGILPDHEIASLALRGMISPFIASSVREASEYYTEFGHKKGEKVLSFGLTSYGYDARLAPRYKIFSNISNNIIDPKNPESSIFVNKEGPYCIIPPNSYILGETVETFDIPRGIQAVCYGKSTLARAGGFLNITPLEPEWRGTVTLEIANLTPIPLKVYAGEGICQFCFIRGTSDCAVSYADKGGKYQDQSGITLGKV